MKLDKTPPMGSATLSYLDKENFQLDIYMETGNYSLIHALIKFEIRGSL